MREQFEAWWRSEMNIEEMDLHRCEFPMQKADFVQPYACHETQRAWLAWQASRAVLEIDLPGGYDPYCGKDGANEYNDGIQACREALVEQGLKVKPC